MKKQAAGKNRFRMETMEHEACERLSRVRARTPPVLRPCRSRLVDISAERQRHAIRNMLINTRLIAANASIGRITANVTRGPAFEMVRRSVPKPSAAIETTVSALPDWLADCNSVIGISPVARAAP
ncbi:hypothetical protein AB3X96_29825 [Paraburkholderia sp. BR13439]|uniref:hypothetical protein n=1 Tax=Paraburkholderia sp. BR13439 TaxID=3236996 RepID=UPI0034CF99FA